MYERVEGEVESSPFDITETHEIDERGRRYTVPEGETYLTTVEVAQELVVSQETVWRWCRGWFGQLPPGRTARRLGYRIPPEYVLVGRAYMVEKDKELRGLIRWALVKQPRNFVVVVGNQVRTYYTLEESREGLVKLFTKSKARSAKLFYVGPKDGNPNG